MSHDRQGSSHAIRLAPRVRRTSSTSNPCRGLIGGRQVTLVRQLVGELPRGRQLVVRLESIRNGDCGRVTTILGLARRRMGIGLFETQRGIGRAFVSVRNCKLWVCEAALKTLLTIQGFFKE